MDDPDGAGHSIAGITALSICESLLIALNELKILTDNQTGVLLERAAARHRRPPPASPHADRDRAVAAHIDRLIASRTWAAAILPAGEADPGSGDDNIEMVAPSVQTQTDSER